MPSLMIAPRRRRRINPYALRAHRRASGERQLDIAEVAGLDHTTISRLERGERQTLPMDVIGRIADHFGVPVSALYLADD